MDRDKTIELAKRWLPWLLMPLGWLLLFGAAYWDYIQFSLRARVLTDDARIVLPNFYRFADPNLFRHDLVGRYHTDGTPDLFRAIYFVAVQFFDLVRFSKLLAHFLWLLTLAGVFVAVLRLAGKVPAFVAICLCLSTEIMLDRIAGALPRGFGFSVVAWMAAALVCGWPRVLAALVVLGAALYSPLAPIGGTCLALLLFVIPKQDRGAASAWSFRRSLVVLTLTGLATALVSAPMMLRMQQYGTLITPAMAAEFPEIGRSGRVGRTNRAVPLPFFEEATSLAQRTVVGVGRDLVPALRKPLRHAPAQQRLALTVVTLAGVIGFALFGLRAANAAARRLCTLGLVSFLGYLVGTLLNPAIGPPQRFAHLLVPIVILIALPVAALGFCPRRWFTAEGKPDWRAGALSLGVGLLLLGLFGATTPPNTGLKVSISDQEIGTLRAIAKLPKRAVIAGWPFDTLDNVPLFTKRASLISFQPYQPYHTRMTLLMRKRMKAMLDVYFHPMSPDLTALRTLRDDFPATHFLLDKRLLQRPPGRRLFEPLRKDLEARIRTWRRLPRAERGIRPRDSLRHAIVYEDRHFVLLELKKLDDKGDKKASRKKRR